MGDEESEKSDDTEEMIENDKVSPEEEAFMRGYEEEDELEDDSGKEEE